jgi:hypothetical protein
VIRTFAKVAYPKSMMNRMSPNDLANRRAVITLFSVGAAPAITAFLISLSNFKPITSINTNVFSSSNVDSSLIGMGMFKKFIQIPGVQFFCVVTLISYIIKNYFPANSITIDVVNVFQFSLVWVLLFTSYSLIVLYVANSIIPATDGSIRELKLPKYIPKLIKRHLMLINVLVHENKQRAVEVQIRVVFMFVLLLFLIISMFSILLYFK